MDPRGRPAQRTLAPATSTDVPCAGIELARKVGKQCNPLRRLWAAFKRRAPQTADAVLKFAEIWVRACTRGELRRRQTGTRALHEVLQAAEGR